MISDVLYIMFGQGGPTGFWLPARTWQGNVGGCHQPSDGPADRSAVGARVPAADRREGDSRGVGFRSRLGGSPGASRPDAAVDEQEVVREANTAFRRMVGRMVVPLFNATPGP
jgi:hypothetical protein